MIFFTADTHFGHEKIIHFCNRPYVSVEEMNEDLIMNWNDRISKGDIVYHLGDFGFGDIKEIVKRLNGQIFLIYGSHDDEALKLKKMFAQVTQLKTIKYKEQYIVLCHYAMRRWDKSHFGSWHLFGHNHGRLSNYGKSFDVGVDAHNYRPISFDEVKMYMDTLNENEG